MTTTIDGDHYSVRHCEDTGVTHFEGSLRLNGTAEYAPIADMLTATLEQSPTVLEWDLTKLEFLNSSGINMMYKFIIGLRTRDGMSMKVVGSSEVPWQAKSLQNMQKFLPALELEIR